MEYLNVSAVFGWKMEYTYMFPVRCALTRAYKKFKLKHEEKIVPILKANYKFANFF